MKTLLLTLAAASALALTAGPARAMDYGSATLAVGQPLMFGPTVSFVDGTRPMQAGGAYTQRVYALEGILVWPFLDDNYIRRNQIAFELAPRVFVGTEETPKAGEDRGAAGAGMGVNLAVRPYSWNTPMSGAIVFHVGPDVATGGGLWWSQGPRVAALMGARITLGFGTRVYSELDYTFVPAIAANAPSGMDVDRQEHRGQLTLGYGLFGIGGRVAYSREVTEEVGQPDARTSSLAITGILQLRFPP